MEDYKILIDGSFKSDYLTAKCGICRCEFAVSKKIVIENTELKSNVYATYLRCPQCNLVFLIPTMNLTEYEETVPEPEEEEEEETPEVPEPETEEENE